VTVPPDFELDDEPPELVDDDDGLDELPHAPSTRAETTAKSAVPLDFVCLFTFPPPQRFEVPAENLVDQCDVNARS
jgi:hypothetical protein